METVTVTYQNKLNVERGMKYQQVVLQIGSVNIKTNIRYKESPYESKDGSHGDVQVLAFDCSNFLTVPQLRLVLDELNLISKKDYAQEFDEADANTRSDNEKFEDLKEVHEEEN